MNVSLHALSFFRRCEGMSSNYPLLTCPFAGVRGERKSKRKAELFDGTILRGMLELPAEIEGCRKMCHVCDFLPCLIGIELVPRKDSIALGKLSASSEQTGK